MGASPQNGDQRGRQYDPGAPFSIRLLERDTEHANEQAVGTVPHGRHGLLPPLPVSYRNDLAAASRHISACIEKELDLQRLSTIHSWLWMAADGYASRVDYGRAFLKPVPRFLLEPPFWMEYLGCEHACGCFMDDSAVSQGTIKECEHRGFRRRALGFLFSYAALISHESDFCIAEEKRLLPPGVRWPAWRTFVEQLSTEHIYADVDLRFYYGELRLSRLNKIYRLWQTPPRGYMSRWNQYGAFFRDHFAWLAGTTVYLVVVLTAMQVGLATRRLEDNDAFQSASYGFTVFSILAPLVYAGLIVLAFFSIFVHNWIATAAYQRTRLQHIARPVE